MQGGCAGLGPSKQTLSLLNIPLISFLLPSGIRVQDLQVPRKHSWKTPSHSWPLHETPAEGFALKKLWDPDQHFVLSGLLLPSLGRGSPQAHVSPTSSLAAFPPASQEVQEISRETGKQLLPAGPVPRSPGLHRGQHGVQDRERTGSREWRSFSLQPPPAWLSLCKAVWATFLSLGHNIQQPQLKGGEVNFGLCFPGVGPCSAGSDGETASGSGSREGGEELMKGRCPSRPKPCGPPPTCPAPAPTS